MAIISKAAMAQKLHARSEPDPNSGCLLWFGATNRAGYGKISCGSADGRKTFRDTHRVAFELAGGVLAPGIYVCHKCDTPSCINPDHLFAGTAADNARDKEQKGRGGRRYRLGEDHATASLTNDQAAVIIRRLQAGEGATKIARSLGVSVDVVADIKRGRTWRHINREAA